MSHRPAGRRRRRGPLPSGPRTRRLVARGSPPRCWCPARGNCRRAARWSRRPRPSRASPWARRRTRRSDARPAPGPMAMWKFVLDGNDRGDCAGLGEVGGIDVADAEVGESSPTPKCDRDRYARRRSGVPRSHRAPLRLGQRVSRLGPWLPRASARGGHSLTALGGEQLAEGVEVGGEEVGLLVLDEVAASGQLGVPGQGALALEPLAWRGVDVAGRRRHGDGHPHFAPRRRVAAVLVVEQHRRPDGLGHPVEGELGEQLVLAEAGLDVAAAVAPGAVLLHQPGGETGRGVVEPDRQRRGRVDCWRA
jgi:hypothetical protein